MIREMMRLNRISGKMVTLHTRLLQMAGVDGEGGDLRAIHRFVLKLRSPTAPSANWSLPMLFSAILLPVIEPSSSRSEERTSAARCSSLISPDAIWRLSTEPSVRCSD